MEKDDIEFFKDMKVIIFLKNKYVHSGFIKNIGSSTLVIDDVKKGLMTINFSEIQEINKDGRWYSKSITKF